jgi:hypothetical protein
MSDPRARTETVYVAVSARGHLAPFAGLAFRRKDLFRAHALRGVDLNAAGYSVVKAKITFDQLPKVRQG